MFLCEFGKMRTLIIDGNNNFIRNYMVNPSVNGNGIPIGGAVGILGSIRKAINQIKPRRVVCIWDGNNGSRQKRKILKEYKEGRKPRLIVGQHYEFSDKEKLENNKEWQKKLAYTLISKLPICQFATDGFEADDAIGYICTHREHFEMDSCVILSSDKDFRQLLTDKVVIFNPIKSKLITKNSLIEEEGIDPSSYLLYKCIDGDKSDNISGVKSFGEKTLKRLFDFSQENLSPETIEEMAANPKDKWSKKKLDKLLENIDIVERNWKLMNLRDPLMSVINKDFVSSKMGQESLGLSVKDFYVIATKHALPLGREFVESFRHLS